MIAATIIIVFQHRKRERGLRPFFGEIDRTYFIPPRVARREGGGAFLVIDYLLRLMTRVCLVLFRRITDGHLSRFSTTLG